ncbi:MAG: hypothetical protein KF696_15745 [Planctomycetes bacterium]|nr:hypothetical protein [Planctomycetota bacterium]MCW8136239.1 hypothetical protein [Planctomycetota bacterium]
MKTLTLMLAALALLVLPAFATTGLACPGCGEVEEPEVEMPQPQVVVPAMLTTPEVVVPAMLTTLALPAGGEFTIESEPTLRDFVIDQ